MNFINPFSLKDRRILITGASSGLGYATAISCAHMGAEVVALGRHSERLQQTLSDLNQISELPHSLHVADLTDAESRKQLVANLGRPIDGVVHCAGISRLSPVRMMTEHHMREVQAVNVEAPMLLTQEILKRNLVSPEGSIVFLASIAAHIGVPGVAMYSGTKAALLAMSRCLAMEVVKRKIRVNCLSPALVETPIFDAMIELSGDASMEQQRNNYPLGFGKPEDVANAVIFLLSNASRWITGTTIVMDGGLTIS